MIFVQLFLTFFKIGFVGFGGGIAILPLIYQGVSRFSDMTNEEFVTFFGISQATPGPIGINAATFVGFRVGGVLGALDATIGVALPSFLMVVLAARFLKKHRGNPLVEGAFVGIRPATVGMIASAVCYVGESTLFNVELSEVTGIAEALGNINILGLAFAVATFVLAKHTKIGIIEIILGMGLIGAFLCS